MAPLHQPTDPAAAPRILLAELAEQIGEPTAARYCASLLDGADPREYPDRLRYLGGRPAAALLAGRQVWLAWPPVWGARGLLYIWTSEAAAAVVRAVSSPQWRVAEMATKVAALRELSPAADQVRSLLGHELPRVRATGTRALGMIGDTEHISDVLERLDDPEADVRKAARLACDRLEARLDVRIERS